MEGWRLHSVQLQQQWLLELECSQWSVQPLHSVSTTLSRQFQTVPYVQPQRAAGWHSGRAGHQQSSVWWAHSPQTQGQRPSPNVLQFHLKTLLDQLVYCPFLDPDLMVLIKKETQLLLSYNSMSWRVFIPLVLFASVLFISLTFNVMECQWNELTLVITYILTATNSLSIIFSWR